MATNSKQYSDEEGIEILDGEWIDASEKFNEYMKNNDTENGFKMLNQANDSFKNVQSHIITNSNLADYFGKVNTEFGDLLAKGNIKDINNYMINAYTEFKDKLDC